MPPDDVGSRRRTAPVQGSGARYEALLEVLEQQAQDADHVDPSRHGRHDGTGGFQKGLLVVLVVFTAWIWIAPPAWLIPAPPAGPTVAEEEAALRFGMYLQAQRIRAYELEHGRLPVTLEEAGPTLPGVTYRLVEPGRYALTGATDRVTVTYRSDEPLREWVGAGADVVNERRLP